MLILFENSFTNEVSVKNSVLMDQNKSKDVQLIPKFSVFVNMCFCTSLKYNLRYSISNYVQL